MKLYFQTQQSIIARSQQKTVVSLSKLYLGWLPVIYQTDFLCQLLVVIFLHGAFQREAFGLAGYLDQFANPLFMHHQISNWWFTNQSRNKIMHKSLFSRLSLVGSSTLYEAHEYQRALLSVLSAALQQKSSTHDEETYLRILELIDALSFDMLESINTNIALEGDAA